MATQLEAEILKSFLATLATDRDDVAEHLLSALELLDRDSHSHEALAQAYSALANRTRLH